jgi:hypothetical protein
MTIEEIRATASKHRQNANVAWSENNTPKALEELFQATRYETWAQCKEGSRDILLNCVRIWKEAKTYKAPITLRRVRNYKLKGTDSEHPRGAYRAMSNIMARGTTTKAINLKFK